MSSTDRRTWLKLLLTTGCIGPSYALASGLTPTRQEALPHRTILMPLASSHAAMEACVEAKRIYSDAAEQLLIHPLTEEAISQPAHALGWKGKYPDARVIFLVDNRASVILSALLGDISHTVVFDSHVAPTPSHDLLATDLCAAGCHPQKSAMRMPEDNHLVCITIDMVSEQPRGINS